MPREKGGGEGYLSPASRLKNCTKCAALKCANSQTFFTNLWIIGSNRSHSSKRRQKHQGQNAFYGLLWCDFYGYFAPVSFKGFKVGDINCPSQGGLGRVKRKRSLLNF